MFNPYDSGSVSAARQFATKSSPSSASNTWIGAKAGVKWSAIIIGGLLAAILVGDLIFLASSFEYLQALGVALAAMLGAAMFFAVVCPIAMISGAALTGLGSLLPSRELAASAPTDPFAEDA